jgi:hypothetical protein
MTAVKRHDDDDGEIVTVMHGGRARGMKGGLYAGRNRKRRRRLLIWAERSAVTA